MTLWLVGRNEERLDDMAGKFGLDEELKNGTAKNGSGSGHSVIHQDSAALTQDVGAVTLEDASVQAIYAELLKRIGEDPTRDGLADAEANGEVHGVSDAGLPADGGEVLHGALFDVDYDEMVIVKDIEFYRCASTTCCRFLARRILRMCRRAR